MSTLPELNPTSLIDFLRELLNTPSPSGLAEKHHIPYKVDIYPHYGSDGEAFWTAGGDVAVALIGPGVDASHSYERTHSEALVATTKWVMAYLLSE